MEINSKDSPLNWRDVFRECITNNVKSPLMLREEGLSLVIRCRPTGSDLMANYWVKFDKNYLLRYLQRYVCKVFEDFSQQEILDLIVEAQEYEHNRKLDLSSLKSYQLRGEEVVRVKDLRRILSEQD